MEEDSDDDMVLEPQAVTVETHIKPENKGFAMLAKLGWEQGQALGLTEGGKYPHKICQHDKLMRCFSSHRTCTVCDQTGETRARKDGTRYEDGRDYCRPT